MSGQAANSSHTEYWYLYLTGWDGRRILHNFSPCLNRSRSRGTLTNAVIDSYLKPIIGDSRAPASWCFTLVRLLGAQQASHRIAKAFLLILHAVRETQMVIELTLSLQGIIIRHLLRISGTRALFPTIL